MPQPLKLQAVLTCRFSQDFNTTMIFKSGTIECDSFDSQRFGFFRDRFTYRPGSFGVSRTP
jgi:hypothetical protein